MTTEDRIERIAHSRELFTSLVFNYDSHLWSVRIRAGHDTEIYAGEEAHDALSKAEHMCGLTPPG